jgi:hypothetical protein
MNVELMRHDGSREKLMGILRVETPQNAWTVARAALTNPVAAVPLEGVRGAGGFKAALNAEPSPHSRPIRLYELDREPRKPVRPFVDTRIGRP